MTFSGSHACLSWRWWWSSEREWDQVRLLILALFPQSPCPYTVIWLHHGIPLTCMHTHAPHHSLIHSHSYPSVRSPGLLLILSASPFCSVMNGALILPSALDLLIQLIFQSGPMSGLANLIIKKHLSSSLCILWLMSIWCLFLWLNHHIIIYLHSFPSLLFNNIIIFLFNFSYKRVPTHDYLWHGLTREREAGKAWHDLIQICLLALICWSFTPHIPHKVW